MPWLGIISYGAAALLYAATAVVLMMSLPSGQRARVLIATMTVSAFWGGGVALVLLGGVASGVLIVGLDALHLFVWTTCVLTWLAPPSAKRGLIALSAAAGAWITIVVWPAGPFAALGWTMFPAFVVMSLVGFLAVEQVFRNAPEERRPLRLLCLAAGGIFTIDLFVYSQATLLGNVVPLLWEARGIGNAALLPLVLLAAKQQSEWQRELFVSRHVVFYTASLLAVGSYLLVMVLVAYALQALGGEWSLVVEILFLFAAVAVLFVALFSTSIRARFRVFLVKHFYRNKYDYREEWLRLTHSLGRTNDLQSAASNALTALARIIGSQQGDLWLEQDAERFEWVVSIGRKQPAEGRYNRGHPLVEFMTSTGWVVDSEEYEREPDRYGTSFGHPRDGVLPSGAITVPLDCHGHLQGFVVLARRVDLPPLNFEDHDILKTAGRQVAVVLAQAQAQEKLAETRQFEAMNKLSAFLMHDLKNIVAQQELVIANAQRFRGRPEFIDDAFATIRSGVERMKRVLEQLRSAAGAGNGRGRVDLSKVLMEVRSQCADRQPIPEIELRDQPTWAGMYHDQLASILTHLVRNAQDATPPDGRITIGVKNGGGELVITVSDTGCGMDAAFLKDRLFRPFDSTKGAKGMGIGAYQVRHLVRLAGGDVEVSSEAGVGTTFSLRLPA